MTMITIYALIRHSRGLGYQGEQDEFGNTVSNNQLIKHFEEKVNRINKTTDSVVLYMQKLVENVDGTPKLDSEKRQELETIYVNQQYLRELSNI